MNPAELFACSNQNPDQIVDDFITSSGSFNGSSISNAGMASGQLIPPDNTAAQQASSLNQYDSISSTMGIPYLSGLLLKAERTATSEHVDPVDRSRARSKIEQLLQTIQGTINGTLTPGSRAPIANTPLWLTPVVMTGGFPTGRLAAGGPLSGYEMELADQLGIPVNYDQPNDLENIRSAFNQMKLAGQLLISVTNDQPNDLENIRSSLNRIWFTEPYSSHLENMLLSGKYRVNTPEEGVMLILMALHRSGHYDRAEELIETISPFLGRVRFFPEPVEQPLPLNTNEAMKSVADVLTQLDNRFGPAPAHKSNNRQRLDKNALVFDQWLPLKDRLVALIQDTVEGDLPYYNTEGELCGGMPLATVTPEWFEKASHYLADRKQITEQHPELMYRTTRKCGSERILQRSLEILLAYPPEQRCPSVTEGFQKIRFTLRKTLADIHRKRGLPGTEQYQQALNQRQAWLEQYQKRYHTGHSLIHQLQPLKDCVQVKPQDLNMDTTGLPKPIKKLLAAIEPKPVIELLERGDIISAEVLASKYLNIVAIVKSDSILDPHLAALFAQVTRAFFKRRSVLLLNLQHQVRMDELPWVKHLQAITPLDGDKRVKNAEKLLADMLTQVFTYFPQTILPNRFIKSLGQMIEEFPELSVEPPLTEELAADIFMHKFSDKFLRAAKQAASLMQGTLYETYYGLDYGEIANLQTPDALYYLCKQKSGITKKSRYWADYATSESGKIIEWQQIITTHNLATLTTLTNTLDFSELFRSENGKTLNHKIARWIVIKCIRYNPDNLDKIRLQEHKNIAYAFRQMIFFLSFQPHDVQLSVLEELNVIPKNLERKITALYIETPELVKFDDMDVIEMMKTGEHDRELLEKKQWLDRLNQKKEQVNTMIHSLEMVLTGQKTQEPFKPFVAWL
ncbi:hypothetical protein J7438_13710 [Thalassotalea sp. G20_0]|uniref:hypothetical protein n=1 Tax=Thalassotalea sp. G20_0 TaxID=2821093 RepID=UPI001ADA0A0C|nr:hypothetical protein [Thalassotalea sp. G20_0]MBO9495137.1 hypothetical protein [Thalassotalea sp. G20_0]